MRTTNAILSMLLVSRCDIGIITSYYDRNHQEVYSISFLPYDVEHPAPIDVS